MIRDPSDGSVKQITPQANEINEMVDKKASKGIIENSALAPEQNHTRDERVRLDKSREWLKKYHEPRPVADPNPNEEQA